MPPPPADHGQTAPLRRYPAADAVLHIGFGDTVEHLGEGQVLHTGKVSLGQFDAHVFKGVEAPHLGAVHPLFQPAEQALVHTLLGDAGPLGQRGVPHRTGIAALAARRHQGAAGIELKAVAKVLVDEALAVEPGIQGAGIAQRHLAGSSPPSWRRRCSSPAGAGSALKPSWKMGVDTSMRSSFSGLAAPPSSSPP